MDAFLLSFAVIFVAELGDKSQLMALAFATRYRAIHVLVGISLATLLVHLGSVILGHTVASLLPTRVIGFPTRDSVRTGGPDQLDPAPAPI